MALRETEENVRVQEEAKDTEAGVELGTEQRAGDGTPPLTATNLRHSSGIALIPQSHGGALLAGGVPGHEGGGGRPKKLTRESLTDAAGKASEGYLKLRDDWLRKAQKYLDADKLEAADKCQKAADRIQEGYLRYGIGAKVTYTIEKPEWIRKTLDSLRWACEAEGLDQEQTARISQKANDRLTESLE